MPGLRSSVVLRPGYAVEYDMVFPDQLTPALAARDVKGLFLAGQINGTSGYEEAAAQGLIAGANAGLSALGRAPFLLRRSDGYAGVLVDDLVTKGVDDPYRMLTSRAEFRLVLRHDNADLRLTPLAREAGLIGDERWNLFTHKRSAIEGELERLNGTFLGLRDNGRLQDAGAAPVRTRTSLAELLRRPEIGYSWIAERFPPQVPLSAAAAEQVETMTKFEGYIGRQMLQVEAQSRLEDAGIPAGIRYEEVRALSMEAREKLGRVRPSSLGQAARIPGVTPADIQVLSILVEQRRRGEAA
jgi:tRNA uridine 5-carboxymethylaminomethyl modification enzyme